MARALIVGCGCRGRELGRGLLEAGWQVRGTTRERDRLAPIADSGIEAVVADPDRAASILDQIEGVTVIYWLLGSALGEPEVLGAIHGPRLERVLEEIVDTPVRGFVYEAAGRAQPHHRQRGAQIVGDAAARWRIPVEIVDADPFEPGAWARAMQAAAERLTS